MAKIGRFELERELGRGTTGVVHLARDPLQGRQVAVRVYEPREGDTPEQQAEARQRFLAEAQAAAMIGHPAIVAVYEVGVDDARGGAPYVVMEFIEGYSLRHWLDRIGRLLPHEAFPLVETLADALETAHASGIAHRRVYPTNILIREPDGVPKIADFGVVRAPGAEPALPGAPPGAELYMSPEQAEGRPAEAASDLFSLAVILYECLCGERPFRDERYTTPVEAGIPETPPRISGRVEGLSPVIDSFFARALAKDPGRRFPTGVAFREALKQARLDQAAPEFGTSTMPVASLEAELDAARVSGVATDFRARQEEDHPIPIDTWGEGRRRWEAERKRREQGRGRVSDGYAVGASSQPAWAPGREDRRSPERSQQPYGRRSGAASDRRSGAQDRRSASSSSPIAQRLERHWPLVLGGAFASFALTVALWRIARVQSPPSAEAPNLEEASGGAVQSIARPASDPPRPNKEPARKGSAAASSRSASSGAGRESPMKSASLTVVLRSRIPTGTLDVLIDGERVLARRLSAPEDSKKLMSRLRGRGQETYETSIAVPPGPHRVLARLRTPPEAPNQKPSQKEDGVKVELKPGETRTVRIVAGRALGSLLSVSLD